MTATVKHMGCDFKFDDTDVVNAEDYRHFDGRAFLLHDAGFTVAVVFASCLQDAIDEAVDDNRLDRFKVAPEELADYGDTEEERDEQLSYLGNASEPFDIESLGAIKLPVVPFSFAALIQANDNALRFEEWAADSRKTTRLSRELAFQESMRDSAERALEEGDPERARACLARARGFNFEEEVA